MFKKYFRRNVWSFFFSIFLIYAGGLFISFDPAWIVHIEEFGRFGVLMLLIALHVLTISCPILYEEERKDRW